MLTETSTIHVWSLFVRSPSSVKITNLHAFGDMNDLNNTTSVRKEGMWVPAYCSILSYCCSKLRGCCKLLHKTTACWLTSSQSNIRSMSCTGLREKQRKNTAWRALQASLQHGQSGSWEARTSTFCCFLRPDALRTVWVLATGQLQRVHGQEQTPRPERERLFCIRQLLVYTQRSGRRCTSLEEKKAASPRFKILRWKLF